MRTVNSMTDVAAIRLREFFSDRALDYAACDRKVLKGLIVRANDHFTFRLYQQPGSLGGHDDIALGGSRSLGDRDLRNVCQRVARVDHPGNESGLFHHL